jgi:uncharacterized protein (DUF885 family)
MRTPIALLVSFLIVTALGWTAELSVVSNEITDEILDFHPITATHLGIHKYDARMPDYSEKALKTRLVRFKELRDSLKGIDTLELSVDDLVDYYLLQSLINDEIFDLEVSDVYGRNPLLYVQACINGVYSLMIRYSPSTGKRFQAISARLKSVPGFLETARQNLKNASYVLCEAGIEQLKEAEKFIEDVCASYNDSLSPDLREELRQVRVAAVAAMMHFAYWLEKNSSDTQFALGTENYNYKLHNVYLIDISADSILKIGESLLANSTMMIDSLNRILTPHPGRMVALPRDFGKKDVENYRRDEIETLRDFVKKADLVTIPDWVGDIEVVETPRFLAVLIPGMAMIPPGPFDALNKSYFFVPPMSEHFDADEAEYYYNYIHNRWFRSGVVHEAYPGHHLQLSITSKNPSAVRRVFQDFFFVEGWAMYCEEMMAKSSLYDDDPTGAMINAFEGIRYRAARIIVDVKLQTGVFTYEDALRFMADVFGGNEGYYASEVKRYISTPTQPSSYLIGKMQLLQLREDYRRLKGDKFDLKEFHDDLLSHGSIPVALVRRIMLH